MSLRVQSIVRNEIVQSLLPTDVETEALNKDKQLLQDHVT